MTRTAGQPVRVWLGQADGARECVELVWDISARAGGALAERCAIGERVVAVAVRLERAAGGAQAEVLVEALTGAGGRRSLSDPRTQPVRWTRDGEFEHIDIEGVVQCTIRHEAEPRVLYARSALLGALAIAPGAYSLRPSPAGG
ncbi:MAG TPA: hypothetical protein VFF69_13635 [Phycisphaerales bacterium]|nr:hypothetical protein [Phycisphaerales bacterium]